MSRVMRLGIIGCGAIAGYMARFAQLDRRIKSVACCDTSPARLARFARRYRIPHTYPDYRQLLAGTPLEAVYVALPHHLHYPVLKAAIEAGRHVLVEKPITRTLEEGQRIAGLAQAQGICLGVNYQYRYDRGCYALARSVQQGQLGQVHYARCHIPWRRRESYFRQAPWHARLDQAGGGTLITQGSHFIDVLLWALDDRPQSVMGYTTQRRFRDTEIEDLAQATIEMASGALVQVSSAMVANPEQAVTIEVHGQQGSAIYTDRPFPRLRFAGRRRRKARPPVRGLHALQRSLRGFRDWVVSGKPYLIPGPAALPALAVVEAIYRSAASGQREPVADCVLSQ
jgi:UDP-N-acetyl-2-amino-2-deoxyglucuronate dehydrogenase